LGNGEFHPEVTHHLGTYTSSPSLLEEWPAHFGGKNVEVEYFEDGDECGIDEHDATLKRRRRTLVIKNPSPQCGNKAWEEWRIVAVTEPTPCTYIFYVCGPNPQSVRKYSPKHHKAPPLSVDLPVLTAYLQGDPITIEDRTTSWHTALPPLPPSRVQQNKQLVKNMFQHAYDSYMYHAYPASEIQPLTCTGTSFSLVKLPALTLVDSLDTLLVLGNTTEFARSIERLRTLGNMFAVNQNVSVFETNIRVLGGLLSAHQMAVAYLPEYDVLVKDIWDANGTIRYGGPTGETCQETTDEPLPTTLVEEDTGNDICTIEPLLEDLATCCLLEDLTCKAETTKQKQNATAKSCAYWSYDGLLLKLAHDLGTRLLPAFDTETGIPYGTINLLHGIPHGETTVASLAGGGTLSLEMELLSRLTQDASFGKAAKLATRALWMRKSPKTHLLGKHIEITRGDWTESLSGIGSNSDSFYEYLIKHYLLYPEDADFWTMFVSAYNGVHNGTRIGEWYADVDMNMGARHGASRRVFESLQAFYPGMQTLVGELGPAARTLNSFFLVRELLGFLPERFNYGNWMVDGGPRGAGMHPLRPELLESCYFLHQATKTDESSGWLWAADFALHTLNELTDTTCGYATVKDLSPMTTGTIPPEDSQGVKLANEMPSFFLSETLKYLYLTFDDTNMLHVDDEREWIFTTEAHPIHFVPKKRKSKESDKNLELNSRKQKVQEMLELRLAKSHVPKRKQLPMTSAKTTNHMLSEKWADNTPMNAYINGILASDSDTLTRKQETKNLRLFRRYLVPEQSQEINQAYMSFGDLGMGDGSSLLKCCPNFHRSALLWVRALNGGVLDYSEVYLSSVTDDLYAKEKPLALTAAQALAYHGSGTFLGEFPERPSCSTSGAKSPTDTSTAVSPDATPMQHYANVQRYDMGGDHGEFEITAFAEGFMLKHGKTGEIVSATILEDGVKTKVEEMTLVNPFVMVYSVKPVENSAVVAETLPKRWKFSGTNWRSFFGTKDHESSPELYERKVVITSPDTQAFRCEVHLLSTHEDDTEEELLSVYPCAPALFGPSRLSRLNRFGELEVGGEVRLPDPSDETGCSDGDSYAPTTVQIVRRGTCTFQSKALNQKMRSGAEAVIVVNNQDDEIFVMSDSGLDEEQDGDIPLTVLMTKHDGDEMIAAIQVASIARIHLIPQKGEINADAGYTGPTGPIDWPMVKTSSEMVVQVLSESGWGVHAINRRINNQKDGREWQLFFMTHNANQD
jgi:mannosidase alpha-like ER degradation enhancer 2